MDILTIINIICAFISNFILFFCYIPSMIIHSFFLGNNVLDLEFYNMGIKCKIGTLTISFQFIVSLIYFTEQFVMEDSLH